MSNSKYFNDSTTQMSYPERETERHQNLGGWIQHLHCSFTSVISFLSHLGLNFCYENGLVFTEEKHGSLSWQVHFSGMKTCINNSVGQNTATHQIHMQTSAKPAPSFTHTRYSFKEERQLERLQHFCFRKWQRAELGPDYLSARWFSTPENQQRSSQPSKRPRKSSSDLSLPGSTACSELPHAHLHRLDPRLCPEPSFYTIWF